MLKLRLLLLCAVLLAALPALAQDKDGDTVPDEAEMAIGMDPDQPETLVMVHDDKSIAEGDKPAAKYQNAPDLTKVWFGNIAGNRYVWRLDFAQDFNPTGVVLIVYLDADNDLSTGRQDAARGCDVMLTCVNGSFEPSIRNDQVAVADRKLRGFISGKSVYMSMDLKLKQTAGQADCRAWILCHMSEPNTGDQDNTTQFAIKAPGESQKPKPPVACASAFRSENMVVQSPWLYWREDLRNMKAVTLDAAQAQLKGMRLFDRALIPESTPCSAILRSPETGKYYVALVLQDSAAGVEELELRVQGKKIAKAVCLQNDGLYHLFIAKAPLTLKKGDAIELVAAAPMQDFQVSEVLLCPQMPEPRPLQIANVAVYCPPQQGEQVYAEVCWTTNMPCTGLVKWGRGKALSETSEPETIPGYNHRVRLEGLAGKGQYSAQVSLTPNYGAVSSASVSFTAAPKVAKGVAGPKRVALQVNDLLPEGRGPWPVNGGIPLSAGELADATKCRLLDAQGKPVPAQFTNLSAWPDGSVKWLLVSLMHRGGGPQYVLEYGNAVQAPKAAKGLVVARDADGLRIVNGALQYSLSRTAFGPAGLVERDTDGDGKFDTVLNKPTPGFTLTDADGNRYTSSAEPCTLTVEEQGPVRTVVLAEGGFAGEKGNLMSWRCRMYFYAGFDGVHTVFTLISDAGKSVQPPTMTPITSLTLPVRAAGGNAARVRWLQDDAGRVVTEQGGKSETKAAQGQGWAKLGGVTVALKDFWQLYPKAFTVEGDTITTEIFPQLPADEYAQYTDPKLLTQHYYWAKGGKYQIPTGVAPSYDLMFYFGDEAPQQVAAAHQTPALLTAAPDQYCGSKAFMDLAPEKPGVFEDFQKFVRQGLEGLEQRRVQGREYSWMDYGDWYGERAVNWGNQEYDLQWGLLLQFVRNGDLRFFDRAEQAARHTAGIDSVNYSPIPDRLGLQYYHCLGHTGGFGMERVPGAEYWFETTGSNTGHMWSQGTITTYCLTGDRRYLVPTQRLADWLAGPYARSFEYYVHRNYGWSVVALLGVYHVDPNPYYLNAAKLFTDYVIAKQDPGTGVLAHPIGECTHKPHHMGGKVFMSGAVMTGLKMLDQIEPSFDRKNAIIRNCDWMYNRMWHPRDNSFQYAQCTDFDPTSTHAGTHEACEGLAYAYDLTNKAIYREMLLRSLADVMRRGTGGQGKSLAMEIRMTPYAFTAIEKWGLKELPPPPAPEPKMTVAPWLYLTSDQPATIGCTLENLSDKPVQAKVEIVDLPAGLQSNARQAVWEMPGRTTVSRGLFSLSGKAKAGETVRVRYQIGQAQGETQVAVRPAEVLKLSNGLGYLGNDDDPVGKAMRQMGRSLTALPDISPQTLARCGALIVGTEAHQKNYAGLRENSERLLDFIYSGGKVAVFQLQDSSWQPNFLPYARSVSDADGTCGEIVAQNHALFNTPARVPDLRGLTSYDTIISADPAWQVLAKDNKGQPSILEASFGKGKVLVVQPSPDRYVIGQLPELSKAPNACTGFLQNVLVWLGQ